MHNISRIRLRAMILEAEVEPTGPVQFDPCDGCKEPCRHACPQKAYSDIVFSSIEMEMLTFPGRNGCFSRAICNIQMEKDIDDAESCKQKERRNQANVLNIADATNLPALRASHQKRNKG